jgi:hypothetical protein
VRLFGQKKEPPELIESPTLKTPDGKDKTKDSPAHKPGVQAAGYMSLHAETPGAVANIRQENGECLRLLWSWMKNKNYGKSLQGNITYISPC